MAAGPLLDRLAPRDQPLKPILVGLRQSVAGHLIMRAIGVDRTKDRFVVEHHVAIEQADIDIEIVTRLSHTNQTDDTACRGAAQYVAHDARCAAAFHDNVRLHV